MKTFFACLCLFIGIVNSLFAQRDSVVIPDPDEFVWSYHLYLGSPILNLSVSHFAQLRNALDQQAIGFSKFQSNSLTSYGFGLQRSRFKIGLDALYGLPNTITKNTVKTRLHFQTFNFHLGYALIFKRNRQWFFNVGIGSQETRVNIYSTATSPPIPFGNLLTGSLTGQSPTLVHKNPCLEFSFEHLFRPKRPVSFSPVVKFGYRTGIKKTTWGSETGSVFQNAPSDRVNQFFIQSIFVVSKNYKKLSVAEKEARRKQKANNDWGLNPR
jgi:hypothetical protein